MGKKKKQSKAAPAQPEPVVEEQTVAQPEESPAPADQANAGGDAGKKKEIATFDDLKRAVHRTSGRGLSLADVDAIIKETVYQLRSFIRLGTGVRIPGLGNFSVVDRKERDGVNPRTGEKITIPARKAVHFSPAKALKEEANG